MKTKKRKAVLLVLLCATLLMTSCQRQEEEPINYDIGMDTAYEPCSGVPDGQGKKAHVLLLTGQSNCTGCSIISYLKDQVTPEVFAEYEAGYPSVKINFNIDNHRTCSEGEFRKTDLLCGSYDEEFGPEVGLASVLAKNFPEEEFFVLKLSMSGYSLMHHWLRDGQRGEIYGATVLFVQNALDYLVSMHYDVSLDAVLWMQGESDTNEEKAAKYYDNQLAFMGYLREDFASWAGPDGIYFIDAGISDSPYCLPGYPTVNRAKEAISKLSPLNLYFSTIDNGLTTMNEPFGEPDLGHYDALSEIRLGELFGECVSEIYRKDQSNNP